MDERTIRVFLDSNVIISGLLSEKGLPHIILNVLRFGLPVNPDAFAKKLHFFVLDNG